MLKILQSSGDKKVKILKAHRTKPLFLSCQESGTIEVFCYEKLICVCRFASLPSYSQVHQLHWVDRSALCSLNVNRPEACDRILAVVDTGLLLLSIPCVNPATDIKFVPLSSLEFQSAKICSLPVSDTIFAVGGSGDSSVRFFDFVSKKVCQRLNTGHKTHHRPSVMGGGSHVKDSGHGSVTDLVSVEPYIPPPSSSSSSSSSADASVRSQLLVVYDTGYAFLYSLEVVGNIIPPNSSPVNRIDNLEKGSPRVGYCAVRNLIFATLSERQCIGIFQKTSSKSVPQFGRSPTSLPLLKKVFLPYNSPTGVVLSQEPSIPSMTILSTTKLSTTVTFSTPTNSSFHTIDVQPMLPFLFKKSRDNQTPKQLKIYEISSTADPSTILLGTNHGIMTLSAPFSDPSSTSTVTISPTTFFHINKEGLIKSRKISKQSARDSTTDSVVLQVPLQNSKSPFLLPRLVLSPSKKFLAIKHTTSLFIMDVLTFKIIYSETIPISEFAWVGFSNNFAVSERAKPKVDAAQSASSSSSKRRSIFLPSKSKKDENEERKVHHEHSKVLLKAISDPTAAAVVVTEIGEIETRGVASRLFGGPTLNVTTTMQNSQFYSFVKNRGGGEPSLKAVGPTLPAPSAIAWSDTTDHFAFLLESTAFVYSTSPLQLRACSKIGTTNNFDDSHVATMKFIEESLFISTTNSVVCCLISDGILDVWTLASSDFTLVGTPGMSSVAASRENFKGKQGPLVQYLPCPCPEIVGIVGTSLILWNCLNAETFDISLDNRLLKSALLAAAGEEERSRKVLGV